MKFMNNNLKNTLSLKVLLITMLGLLLNGCTTNDSESTTKALSEPQEQVQEVAEPAAIEPEPALSSAELQAQQEAARIADEQALQKKAEQEKVQRLAQQKAKQQAAKQKADRLAFEQAKQKLEAQEEAERLFLQQAKQKAQEEQAERLALQQAQMKAEQAQIKQQAEQEAELLAQQKQQQAEEQAMGSKPLTEQETQQEAEALAQQLVQQEAELLAQYEGARKARVEQALNRLAQANYAFEAKREVFVDGLAEIEVVMQLPSALSSTAESSLTLALLDEKFKVHEFVEIKLESSSPNDLTITPISEELQSVSDSTNPKWKWSIMAKKEGTYPLLLNIMPLINIENSDGTFVQTSGGNKTITEVIEVMARPFSLWDWSKTAVGMITIVIGTIITGVLINVLINLVRIRLASNKLN